MYINVKPTISIAELDLRETIFTWEDAESKQQLNFLPERITKAAKDLEIRWVNVDPEFAQTMRDERGLEEHRLNRITGIPNDWEPITLCDMPDGTALIVDGNHRYYRAAQLGSDGIKARLVPMKIWRHYLTSLPDADMKELKKGFSGLM